MSGYTLRSSCSGLDNVKLISQCITARTSWLSTTSRRSRACCAPALNAQGYEIRVANDGETALEIVKDFAPDLVITDLADAEHEWHRAVPPACARFRRCRFWCSRCAAKSAAKLRLWTPARTTTSPSRSAPGNCWRGFGRRCGARLRAQAEPKTKIEAGDFRIDLDAHSVARRRARGAPHAEGVRCAGLHGAASATRC